MSKSPWNRVPLEYIQIWCPVEFDLSAAAESAPIFYKAGLNNIWGNTTTTVVAIITSMIVVYSEATSADAGVSLELGFESDPDYYARMTSEVSKSQWATTVVAQASFSNDRVFTANDNLIMAKCAGGKTGAGKVRIGITLSFNHQDYTGFTP